MISLSGLKCMAVGNLTHDRYQEKILPGGCAFYAASVWQSLGCESSLLTSLGEDFKCHSFLNELDTCTSLCAKTTTFVNRYDEAGNRVQHVSAVGEKLKPETAVRFSKEVDVLFLAPVLGELDPDPWLDVVDARITGLGLQGLLRQADTQGDEESFCLVVPARKLPSSQILQRLDAVFLSLEDLHGQPDGLLEYLRKWTAIVVLTRGFEGSSVYWNGRGIDLPAYSTELKDPTGAGDTYAATFLAVLAAGGYQRGVAPSVEDVRNAAKLSAAAAAIVIQDNGPLRMPQLHMIQKMIM